MLKGCSLVMQPKKLLSLVSGGIDSPVASYLMLKQNYSITLLHFYNFTASRKIVKDKVEKLARIIAQYVPKKKIALILIPFEFIQRKIIAKVPGKYRMILYRRIMFKLAEALAKETGAEGLITGDSLGQVASQTLTNLSVLYRATSLKIYAPLIGFFKKGGFFI